jgi:hypothetical protein
MGAVIGITHVGANETIADLTPKERAAPPDISFLAQPPAQYRQYFYNKAIRFLCATKTSDC